MFLQNGSLMRKRRNIEERFCDRNFNVIHPVPISSPIEAKKVVFATTTGDIKMTQVSEVPPSPFKKEKLEIPENSRATKRYCLNPNWFSINAVGRIHQKDANLGGKFLVYPTEFSLQDITENRFHFFIHAVPQAVEQEGGGQRSENICIFFLFLIITIQSLSLKYGCFLPQRNGNAPFDWSRRSRYDSRKPIRVMSELSTPPLIESHRSPLHFELSAEPEGSRRILSSRRLCKQSPYNATIQNIGEFFLRRQKVAMTCGRL